MLHIELVRVGNRLVGRTVSDRFNLLSLGIGVIGYDRNHRAAKTLRRKLQNEGFSLSVVRGGKPQWAASPAESEAFSGAVPAFLQAA
jgi:hypothetical protein